MYTSEEHKNIAMSKVELDLTYRCDRHCVACSRCCAALPREDSLSLADVELFIKETKELDKKWRTIGLYGGEPTLHPDLLEILELLRPLHEAGMAVHMGTNGAESFKRVKDRLPKWLGLVNTNKVTDNGSPHFFAFNVAPEDVGRWKEPYIVCDRYGCGICLTPYGYYPCTVAGGLRPAFPERIPDNFKTLHSVLERRDEFFGLLCKMCPMCGWYMVADGSTREYPHHYRSKSWRTAIAKFKDRSNKV